MVERLCGLRLTRVLTKLGDPQQFFRCGKRYRPARMPIFRIVSALNTSGINGLNGMIQATASCIRWIAEFWKKVAVAGETYGQEQCRPPVCSVLRRWHGQYVPNTPHIRNRQDLSVTFAVHSLCRVARRSNSHLTGSPWPTDDRWRSMTPGPKSHTTVSTQRLVVLENLPDHVCNRE